MSMNEKIIKIKPYAKHHGLFIVLSSVMSLAIIIVVSLFVWQQAKFSLMFLIALSLAMLLLGFSKLLEPNFSIKITPKQLTYLHRKGQWQLDWQAIKSINLISNTHGLTLETLDYLGVSLTSTDEIIGHISPRLANQLIHEQKPLLAYSLRSGLITSEQAIVNFDSYTNQQGEEIFGPIAGFLHQCDVLNLALGSHLFIAQINVDRPLNEFVTLLKHCQRTST